VEWIVLVQDKDKWWAVVKMAMIFWGPHKMRVNS
jgi:hypothetical protein